MRALCFVVAISSLAGARAQYFTNHTDEDGLIGARVRCTTQDGNGYLWVATFDGLSRFDGGSFRNFSSADSAYGDVPQGMIDDVVADAAGDLWIISQYGGLCRYDHRRARFEAWGRMAGEQDPDVFQLAHGLAPVAADSVFAWSVESGLVVFHPVSRRRTTIGFPEGTGLGTGGRWIKRDPARPRLLWIANKRGLYTWDMAQERFETHLLGEAGSVSEQEGWSVDALHFAKDGSLQVGVRNKGLMRYDPGTRQWDPQVFEPNVDAARDRNSVFALADLPEGLCMGTAHGLVLLDEAGRVVQRIAHEKGNAHSLLPGRILDLFVAREGTLWVSSPGGLSQWSPRQNIFRACAFETAREEGAVPLVTGVAAHSGGWLLGTRNAGILRLDPEKGLLTEHPVTTRLGGKAIVALFRSNVHGLLCWTDEGLNRLDGDALRPVPMVAWPQGASEVGLSVMEDAAGRIYTSGVEKGIRRTDLLLGTSTTLPFDAPGGHGRADDLVKGMTVDAQGRVWLAYFNKGLKVIFPDGAERDFRKEDHPWMGHALIWDLEVDKQNRLWMVTKNDGVQWVHVDRLLAEKDLMLHGSREIPSVSANLFMYNDRQLWVSGTMGLAALDLHDMSVRRFGRADGLETDPFFSSAFHQLNDGQVLITVNQRMPLLVHPDSISGGDVTPSVVIERAIVNGRELSAWKPGTTDGGIDLSYDKNHLTIHFTTIAFTHRDRIALEYMLEGSADPPVRTGPEGMATFAGLAPGNYRMVVRRAGDTSGAVLASLPVKVRPAVWQTWWFRAGAALVVVALGFMFYRRRMRQVREQARLRIEFQRKLAEVEMSALRAQMNPHFLFNSLNSINRYIVKNEPKLASEYLTKFSRLMRLVLNNSKQQVVPLQDELDALNLYIELESLRFNNRFELDSRVELDTDASTVMVPPMLLQPYVENAIWHGLMHKKEGVPKLKLHVLKRNGQLRFEVEDNGVGREQSALLRSKRATDQPSHGTRITRERLELVERMHGLKTEVHYTDLKDLGHRAAGTRVTITITNEE
ncbi:MAG: histidine kinase [Flavobacteriales bacterium]|nr:MAG: histidine kinase [Flavobacteriales bacterium]